MTQQWETDAARWPEAILELRTRVDAMEAWYSRMVLSRVEALEVKYETQRLATLEWGEDVDKVKSWSDQHLQRIEALEARRPASKIYEINEPLQLTPEQAQQVMDLLTPNSKPTPNSSQIGRSLVERVQGAQVESVKERSPMARAAIREVAAWLDENTGGDAAWMLTQEAEQ